MRVVLLRCRQPRERMGTVLMHLSNWKISIFNKDLGDALVRFETEDLHQFPNQDFREAWDNLCWYVETSDVAPLMKEEFDANYWFCNCCGTLLDESRVIMVICDEHKQYLRPFVHCPSYVNSKPCCKVCNMYDPDTHRVVHEVEHYTC